MAEQLGAPILSKPIPSQIVHEGASYSLILTHHIQNPNDISGNLRFKAELSDGKILPEGLVCSINGLISGTPENETKGQYDILITAENDSGIPFTTPFSLTIKERIKLLNSEELTEYKNKIWEAVKDNLPLPEMADIFAREITPVELYYLLQRFAVLTIWDVYNLDPPGEKRLLTLDGISKHFNIYDRGSCLVGAPKDLFSYERTLADAIQTSRVMAREAYKRNWTVELSGFNKMIRASWVELQHLSDQHGRAIDVLHFNPSTEDVRIYTEESRAKVANEMGL